MIKKFLATSLASLALLGATTASATSASALSLSNAPAVRAVSSVDDGNDLAGGASYVLGAIALGLTIWGVVELADDDSP